MLSLLLPYHQNHRTTTGTITSSKYNDERMNESRLAVLLLVYKPTAAACATALLEDYGPGCSENRHSSSFCQFACSHPAAVAGTANAYIDSYADIITVVAVDPTTMTATTTATTTTTTTTTTTITTPTTIDTTTKALLPLILLLLLLQCCRRCAKRVTKLLRLLLLLLRMATAQVSAREVRLSTLGKDKSNLGKHKLQGRLEGKPSHI